MTERAQRPVIVKCNEGAQTDVMIGGDCQIIRVPPIDRNNIEAEHILLAEKYAACRLFALRSSPEAFASTFGREAARTTNEWLYRLVDPRATFFVVIQNESQIDPDTLDHISVLTQCSWRGMIILHQLEQSTCGVAPNNTHLTWQSYDTTHDELTTDPEKSLSSQSSESRRHLYFSLNGTFVDPMLRGHGLATALLHAALNHAALISKANAAWTCTVLVDSENEAARRTYLKARFKPVGQERYLQEPRTLIHGESVAYERTAIRLEFAPSSATRNEAHVTARRRST